MSLLDSIKPVSQITQAPKILVYAKTQLGKTHDALENLPRPLLHIDTDTTAKAFDDGRFPEFDVLPQVFTMKKLVEALREFTSSEVMLRKYKALVIDSLSVVWDNEVRRLGLDGQGDRRGANLKQAELAALAKELKDLLKIPSAYGIVVYATAEVRNKAQQGQNYDPNNTRAAAGLSEEKFFYAFDLCYRKDAQDVMEVDKCRYSNWKKGDIVQDFSFQRHVMPIVRGEVKRRQGFDAFEPATPAHETLLELLGRLGSKSKGGALENAEMQTLLALTKTDDSHEGEVMDAISRLNQRFSATQTTAANTSATSAAVDNTGVLRSEIETRLKALGSQTKGGCVPDADARRIYNASKTASTEDELRTLLGEVAAFEPSDAAVL